MSEKILELRPGAMAKSDASSQGVIDILRKALAMAEAGEFHNVVVTYSDRLGQWGRMFDGSPSCLFFAASRFAHEMQIEMDKREAANHDA